MYFRHFTPERVHVRKLRFAELNQSQIKEMERSAKQVHAIMNNNYSNYSVKNAQRLEELLAAWQA